MGVPLLQLQGLLRRVLRQCQLRALALPSWLRVSVTLYTYYAVGLRSLHESYVTLFKAPEIVSVA